MTTLLQHLDDLVLVLWEHFGETVCPLNKIVLSRAGQTSINQLLRVVDLGTKSKHLACFLGNGDGVTRKHLDWDTELLSLDDGLRGILTRGIEHRQETTVAALA
jgi:hypothetical protein